MISYSNLKSFSATCKLTLAHICGDESWECKALEQIYFDDTFRWKGNWYSSYLLTISSGSGIARCLASDLEFRILLTISSGSGIARCLASDLEFRILLTISAGSGTARCLASGLEFWYSSYGLGWCRPVRVRFGVPVTPVFDTRKTVSIRVKLGLADSDSERNI